jgi:GGDEF domain-containing protein
MTEGRRWFWVGSREGVQAAVTAVLGRACVAGSPAAAGPGDLVVVDALAGASAFEGLPFGHAFAVVRGLKEKPGVVVYVVVDRGDRIGAELARFCLADGVLAWDEAAATLDTGAAVAGELADRQRARPSVDKLLERVQSDLRASGREDSTLERLLQFERDESLLHRLQDSETGLFDGPYATLKLDEEWKRATRFHQALSLLLVDLGAGIEALPDADRRSVLAEASGVFLNECRDIDVLARFQPTVFLFLLPGTGPEGAEVLARRILQALGQRLRAPGLQPAAGLCSVPSSEIRDRKAFLAVAEACLRRAQSSGTGGLCTTWQ